MLVAFAILLVFTILITFSTNRLEKKQKQWLEDAKKAYNDNEFTADYPRSEIERIKTKYKYDMSFRLIFSSWAILLVCPFLCSIKTYIIIYLVNYMFSRILIWLAIIEQKIDIVKSEVFKESDI